MVGELSQEFLRSQRAAKLAEKMCQCYDHQCYELLFLLFRMAADISDVVSINVVLGSL